MVARRRLRKLVDRVALAASVALLLAPCLFVFFWMLSLSLKYDIDNTAWPPVFWPEQVTFENFAKVFEESPMFLYFWNSVQVTGSATLVSLLLGVPAGYGIAKAKANKMAGMLLLSRMTPGLSYLIPLFTLFQILGLIGTVWPIALTHLVITLPIVVWIMIGFFETLPHELEEAARIDGATDAVLLRRIIWPLVAPATTIVFTLTFIGSFNWFELPYIMAGISGAPGGATDVLGLYFYRTAFGNVTSGLQDFGHGSALAVLMFLFIAVFSAVSLRVLRRREIEI